MSYSVKITKERFRLNALMELLRSLKYGAKNIVGELWVIAILILLVNLANLVWRKRINNTK